MTKSITVRTIVQDQPGFLHAGVDLALEKNLVKVIDERARHLDQFSFTQDRNGYDYCLGRLDRLRQKVGAQAVVIAMEPSNFFWKLLAAELERRQIPYRLVNAYTVKKHREGDQLDPSKDDRRDAAQIAELSRTGHFTQTRLQKGVYEELRQYATLHEQLMGSLCREKNILWGLVGQVFPELSQVLGDLNGQTAQALLRSGVASAWIRSLDEQTFLGRVRGVYAGKKLALTKLRRVHALAATSIGVTEGLTGIHLSIQLHLDQLQLVLEQRDHLNSAMGACLKSVPEAPYVLSLPGVQPTWAALFLAEVGDPSRYHSAAQWVKLAGIQPAPNRSGKKQRSKTPMSHRGRPRLRFLLYFTCLRLLQQDPYFARLYLYLLRRPNNPLTKMQAVGVLMNKLLHILWALIQHHTLYTPDLVRSSSSPA